MSSAEQMTGTSTLSWRSLITSVVVSTWEHVLYVIIKQTQVILQITWALLITVAFLWIHLVGMSPSKFAVSYCCTPIFSVAIVTFSQLMKMIHFWMYWMIKILKCLNMMMLLYVLMAMKNVYNLVVSIVMIMQFTWMVPVETTWGCLESED